jgi:hypothetical protein
MALASSVGGRSTKIAQSLAGRAFTVVPRPGIEPGTHGFSDRCSTGLSYLGVASEADAIASPAGFTALPVACSGRPKSLLGRFALEGPGVKTVPRRGS